MIKQNEFLNQHVNYQIGGPAKYFIEFQSVEELKSDLEKIQTDLNIFVLGGGTNILVGDKGFDGVVIRSMITSLELLNDYKVLAGSAVTVKDLNNFCTKHGLSGLEWSGGLPGTIGGAVFGNAGAFGGETKDSVDLVKSFNLDTWAIKDRTNKDCNFGYRKSVFKENIEYKEIILSVTLKLKQGDPDKITAALNEKINYRQVKQPLEYPSAGSTFKSIPWETLSDELKTKFTQKKKDDPFAVLPAAVLIADAGLIGLVVGGAKVSDKHPNFLINYNHASASDVQQLIKKVIKTVKDKYNLILEPELIILKYK